MGRTIAIPARIQIPADIIDFPELQLLAVFQRALEDGEEGAGFVPPTFDVCDGDGGLGLDDLPEGDGPARLDGRAVAVFEVLPEADG